jgi:predicted  nucleic acid-binding Zn-ribbon protein
MRRKTQSEYDTELISDGRGYRRLAPFQGVDTKILHQCPVERRHVWEAAPDKVTGKSKRGCPFCSGRRHLLTYQQRLDEIGKGIVAEREPHACSRNKISHRCTNCNYRWDATPNGMLSHKTGCPVCSGKRLAKPYQELLDEDGRGWVALEPYKNSGTAILHRCPEGHEVRTSKGSLLNNGNGCKICAGHTRDVPYDQWLMENRPDLKALEPYQSRRQKALHQCVTCSHQWRISSKEVTAGNGCPVCADRGFNPSQTATLYCLKHQLGDGRVRVNVGITNLTVEKRYTGKDLKTILRGCHWSGHGAAIEAAESEIHNRLGYCLDRRGLGLVNKRGSQETFDLPYRDAKSVALEVLNEMGMDKTPVLFSGD